MCKIDFDMFDCSQSKIDSVSIIDFSLKLQIIAFESKHDFYTEVYYSSHFYLNISKHKPLYI